MATGFASRRVRLTCGHGRLIAIGSDEDRDAIEYGWTYCLRCSETVALADYVPPAQPAVVRPTLSVRDSEPAIETPGQIE